MSLAIGGISGYTSMAKIEPINYSLANQAQVSDSFEDTLKAGNVTSSSSVPAVTPVLYPNAQMVDSSKQVQASIDAGKEFNKIGQSFSQMTTGYNNAGSAMGYQMLGGSFDTFV